MKKMQLKSAIREKILLKRRQFSLENKSKANHKIIELLSNLSCIQKSKNILFYYPMKDEVDLLPFASKLINNKTVLLPFVTDKNNHYIEAAQINSMKDIQLGTYKIMEPKNKEYFDLNKIDCVLVPGVAFDHQKYRIGMGKGYYDNFLPRFKNAKKIGIAFDFQVLDHIPHEEHDVIMDLIVTEKQTIA